MLRINEIQDNLLHLIGWEQNYDTTNIKIAKRLTKSESGLYFQQAHPLLTLENLSSIAPDFKNITYPDYISDTQYGEGNIVSFNGKLYKASKPVINIEPTDINYWEETNPFSEWLERKTKASIQKAITRFITEKLIKHASKTLIEDKVLFDGTGRLTDTIRNRNNFVGFEIVPIRAKGITTKINRIGLQFTEPGEYTIFLMHSSSDTPIKVFKLTKLRKNSLEWFDLEDVFLPYVSDTDAGGSWYIGYFQSSLPAGSQAINKSRDWSKGPCAACSRREFETWNAITRYLEVHPFYVKESLINAVSFSNDFNNDFEKQLIHLWDIENNEYTYDKNYGLNLDISVCCDLTDFIISQRALFQDVILKQLGVDILREFAYNPNVRTNRHSINASRTDILYEIDGDSSSMKKSGLSYQLEQAYKAIAFSTEGLARVCLPCINNGIKYRTI